MKANVRLHITGETTDEIFYLNPDKTIKKVEVIKDHNIIVYGAETLIALLLKDPRSSSNLYWAVGRGDPSWDEVEPIRDYHRASLVSEVARYEVLPSDVVFIDDDGNIADGPTNRIRITKVIGEEELVGESLREHAVFGYNATSTPNSGIMMNWKIHPVIIKDNTMRIRRSIIFTIKIV